MTYIIKIISITGLLILIGCKSEDPKTQKIKEVITKTTTDSKKEAELPKHKEKSNSEILTLEASRLRAGGSVKSAVLKGRKAVIMYVKDYDEYKAVNPKSIVT